MVAGLYNQNINEKLKKNKITDLQIDPFGYCNAKCWFCPVAYKSLPADKAKHMHPDLFEKIIHNLVYEKEKINGIVSSSFNHFYTAHYNEVMLYKYLEEMFTIARKYNLKTTICSNGTNFSEKKIEILKKYKDTIAYIYLNIPAFEEDLWKKRSGIKNKSFKDLKQNVINLMNAFPDMVKQKTLSIGVNVPNKNFGENIILKKKSPDIDTSINGELFKQVELGRKIFNNLTIYPIPDLTDRAGFLSKREIISNEKIIQINSNLKKEVADCNLGESSRLYQWLHVNSLGEAFICCNDYDYDYVFGSLANQNLSQIWFDKKHVDVINQSLNNMCKNCCNAVWE